MEGWIKLHRKITDNWIFANPNYFKAWTIMLFTVNYESKKVLINGQLIECNRGQSVLSLDTWVDKFGVSKKSGNWTIQKVRTFFDLLEKDHMIIKENVIKSTRITICNYDTYQSQQHDNNTIITTEQHANNKQITTTKEGKEIKNKERVKFTPPTQIEILSFFSDKIKEKGKSLNPKVEAEKFESFYKSKGWMVGKNKMVDWRSAAAKWIAISNDNLKPSTQQTHVTEYQILQ